MLDRLSRFPLSSFFEASLEGVAVLDEDGRYLYVNPSACRMVGYSMEEVLQRTVFMDVAPHWRPALEQSIAAEKAKTLPARFFPALKGEEGHPPHPGTGWLVRADGEEFEIDYVEAPIRIDGRLYVIVMFRDVTEARRLARKAEALAQIASTVAVAGSLEETLEALARRVVEATETMYCGLFLIDEVERCIRVYGGYGKAGGHEREVREAWESTVRAGAPAPGFEAVEQGRPVIVRDPAEKLLADSRYALVHDHIRREACGAAAAVPMRYGKRIVGWMNVSYAPGRYPSETEIAFLGTIADQAAVAAEIARLLVEAREKAALQERQRLARELHDSVSQALYGIALGARTARTLLDRDPAKAAEPLEYVLSLAEAGLAEMRALIFELRPESLKEEGLVVALTKQIDSVRARHKISVQADLPAEPEIPLEAKEAVYRIAQEALTNTIKHARANRIELRLVNGDERVVLEVADNGVGFDDGESFPGHLGLRSMRERATGVGGTLEVETAPGGGTRVRARIPVQSGV